MLPGAQIIDLMLLVVDVTKGVQTQTAEVRQTLLHVCHIWLGVGGAGGGGNGGRGGVAMVGQEEVAMVGGGDGHGGRGGVAMVGGEGWPWWEGRGVTMVGEEGWPWWEGWS